MSFFDLRLIGYHFWCKKDIKMILSFYSWIYPYVYVYIHIIKIFKNIFLILEKILLFKENLPRLILLNMWDLNPPPFVVCNKSSLYHSFLYRKRFFLSTFSVYFFLGNLEGSFFVDQKDFTWLLKKTSKHVAILFAVLLSLIFLVTL